MKLKIILKVFFTIQKLRRQERMAPAELASYRAARLKEMREYAYTHSPFYRRFHAGHETSPLESLPVLTKSAVMDNFDELVTDRRIQLSDIRDQLRDPKGSRKLFGKYWIAATSGSTGEPGIFLFSETEWVTMIASFARGQDWAGAGLDLRRRRRIATVASLSPWHLSSQLMVSAKSWFTPSIPLAASDPLERNVEILNRWRPHLLVGYASMLRLLAEESIAGRLGIQPEKVFTSSEVLTEEARRRIKEAWGDEPYNQYGSTETAALAAEHRSCRRMHLFDDLLIVEVVDDKNRPVPPGRFGSKVLVTTLFSRTQPLIRYVINDSVRIRSEKCPECHLPFTVLDAIQGRREDALMMAGAKGKVVIQPLIFNRVMDFLPVSGWQISQEKDGSLTVLLSGLREPIHLRKLADRLKRELIKEGVISPKIKLIEVDQIPKSASGKAPLVRAYRRTGGAVQKRAKGRD